MNGPDDELAELKEHGLLRALRAIGASDHPKVKMAGRTLLNFSSNDYLGLAQHPALIDAACRAVRDYGTGSTASRLVCGSLDLFHTLEERIAAQKSTQAALVFANGFATALGTIPALVGNGDTVIVDKLAHACLIDGARLSGATLRVFPHNDLNKLERLLKSSKGRTLIVTESVFSMDGDLCPLAEIVRLKDEHGALLLLDEAHAVGVLGPDGHGLAAELSLQDHVDFQMGTLGKALGSAGGYIAASQIWVDLLINKARSLIYSTAPPPSQAAASLAAFQVLESPEGDELMKRLRENCAILGSETPIAPLILGENEAALAKAEELLELGYLVPAIRYPTVPRGTARLRITVSAAHSREEVLALSGSAGILPVFVS